MSSGMQLRRRSTRKYVPNKHRYWRIRSTKIQGAGASDNMGLVEVEMRAYPGGPDQCSGGTALSDSDFSGAFPKTAAFDNNTSTIWSSTTGGSAAHWIGYDFGTAVNVNEVFITSRTDYLNSNVLTAFVESSDNGSAWTTQWQYTLMADWTAGETRTLTRPAYGDQRRYWRLYFGRNFIPPNNYASFSELAIHELIGGSNIATSSNITADTTFDASNTVTNLFDSSTGTWWVSGNVPAGTGNVFPHWLIFDAGSPIRVGEYLITSRSSTESLMPAVLILQASSDQKTWVDYKLSGYPGVVASTAYQFLNEPPFQYVAS